MKAAKDNPTSPVHVHRAMPPLRSLASVVVCSYSEARWDALVRAIDSVHAQSVAAEVVLVVDANPPLAARARQHWRDVTVVENTFERGLSGARNTGLRHSSGEIVAFLDDDAAAAPDWLEHLLSAYEDAGVVAAGGAVEARWEAGRPRWFPPEFDWVVGCTYTGMPDDDAPVRNVVGANMSFRRDCLLAGGGFNHALGRVGDLPLGCEETEACIRAVERTNGSVAYRPRARVSHTVPASRSTWRYFARRCHAEGRSKAALARMVGPQAGLASEWAYVLRTLPAALVRNIAQAPRDRAGPARAGALMAGLILTAGGYVAGRLSEALLQGERRGSGDSAAASAGSSGPS